MVGLFCVFAKRTFSGFFFIENYFFKRLLLLGIFNYLHLCEKWIRFLTESRDLADSKTEVVLLCEYQPDANQYHRCPGDAVDQLDISLFLQ